MSHVKLQTFILTDLDCLAKAGKHLGMDFLVAETYNWYKRHVGDYPLPEGFTADMLGKCQYKLSISNNPTAYEVGVVNVNGQWRLIYDFWAGGLGLEAVIGKDAENLYQRYQVEVLKKQLEKEGHRVTEEWNEEEQEYVVNAY